MPSMESSFMAIRKHDESCGRGVPELNSVGDACVIQRSDSMWYVSTARSTSLWMPMETRISRCWGRSTILPSMRSRYERSRVLYPK